MRQCEEDRVGSRGCPVLVALLSKRREERFKSADNQNSGQPGSQA